MDKGRFSGQDFRVGGNQSGETKLVDGSRVAVVGGGPAGSFFAYYLLDLAQRSGLDLKVDIYEPRNYQKPGPIGCNMCGGIISESLVQNLAIDGINLPSTVVQRGIDSYMLHTDVGSVRIETPLDERRIGAVHRGSGPRDLKEATWDSFDGFLQGKAVDKGVVVIREKVADIAYIDNMPAITLRNQEPVLYDLAAIAVGINSPFLKKIDSLDLEYRPPESTKTFICEYFLGREVVEEYLGSSMHVYLLNIPRLEFAALIPKGDYVTCALLGKDIDKELIDAFLSCPEVKGVMPPGWSFEQRSCQCSPRINSKSTSPPYGDRIVFIGDSGVTRLYKDGIGAAYRTAKAAASAAIFQGVSKADFRKHFMPACETINQDNSIGRVSFFATEQIQKVGFARQGLVSMTRKEQENEQAEKRMSLVMWDMFTGSAPYRDIFRRMIHPAFLAAFIREMALAIFRGKKKEKTQRE